MKDPEGKLVPGVTITISQVGTGLTRVTKSNPEGHWIIPALPTGSYRVTLEVANFKKTTHEDVAVDAAVTRTLDTALEVGGVEQVITVTGGAKLITPETAANARTINATAITAIPTPTRSVTAMGLLL